MRLESYALNVPGTATAGLQQAVGHMREKYVQVAGTFVGSLDVEVSLDGGNNFFVSLTGITGPTIKSIPEPATHIRVNVTAFSSGTPVVTLNGYNIRTDV